MKIVENSCLQNDIISFLARKSHGFHKLTSQFLFLLYNIIARIFSQEI